jgi:hypothetical protein
MNHVPVKISALALMMTSALAHPALAGTTAATKPPPAALATPIGGEKAKDIGEFSQAGHSAMMNIGDARLAIFDGDPKVAMKLMESAKRLLARADKDAPSMGNPPANGTTTSVPVDGQLALSDDFVMSPEKQAHIDKANESFKKGDHATGLEQLRLGAIDVNYTRWWLPIAPTEAHLNQAIKLAGENKYYEANLALKAIEDSVTMDSISFSDLPATPKSAKNAS